MAVRDVTSQRLFVADDLDTGITLEVTRDQTNYLINVLRLKVGDGLLLFNGRDGEWHDCVVEAGRKACSLEVLEPSRSQVHGFELAYLFAPLKRARLDFMVQKATEMGVASLQPVMTERTQVNRINLDRMRANVIEAAEQCGILRVPVVSEPVNLDAALARFAEVGPLVFCDEAAQSDDPVTVLSGLPRGACTVLIGPEGGFSNAERQAILEVDNAVSISLGPRIMRADTAAVAALALVNATLGDWRP